MIKSLKKIIPKRKYRERSQLGRRKKLGLLEKKEDYKIRAEDYHKKEARYQKLKEAARTRNPEEFYFNMVNSKIIDGEHTQIRDEKSLEERLNNHDKLLNLVNLKKSLQEKEKEKILNDLQFSADRLNLVPYKNHTHQLFFDNEEDCIKSAPEIDHIVGRKTQRKAELKHLNDPDLKQKISKFKQKSKNVKSLTQIANTLAYQKHLLNPGKKKKIGDNTNSYKFFNERKK